MKKLMLIGMAAAVLLTFAGQAKATALETSGELRARGWWVDNYVVNGQSTEWFDQRLRLSMVWPVAEGVKVNVRADILEGFWGDNNQAFQTTFNTTTNTVTSSTAGFGTRPPINFDHVNMQFKWPGTPLTFTVGRQDVSYATGMYAKADNRDRFKVVATFSPEMNFLFAYDKTKEFFNAEGINNLDDARAWSVAGFGTVQGWFWGVLALYALDDSAGGKGAGNVTRIGVDATTSGKAGPVDLKVDVAFITGDNEITGKAKVDASGLMAYVSAAMPAGPVTVTLEGAYAAGDDPKTTDKNEGAARFDYQSSFWSIILYTNLDVPGYVGSSSGNQMTSDVANDYSVTNAIAGKATVAWSPMKGFTLMGSAVYSQALQDVAVVTPAKAATATTPAVPAKTTIIASNPLGTEFDVVAVYNITDNVYFLGGFGYLVAGDFFGEVDNPMGVMGSLNVKF